MYLERASTHSFVELHQFGPELLRRWGPVEKTGTERLQTFPSAEEARQALQRQAYVLERKGYLAGRQNAELLSLMERAPDDPGPFLVYADWLLERGDPRGELISRMSRGEDPEALLAAQPQLRPPWWSRRVTLTWRLGFVHSLTYRHSAGVGPQGPWELRHLLRHPSAHFVRTLVLEGVSAPYAHVLQAWRALLESRRPLLERVELRRCLPLQPLAGQIRGIVVR